MDWIKVKASHVFYEYANFSPSEFKAWIKIMCLVAIMEKIPNESEILSHINNRTFVSLRKKLNEHRTDIETIMKKVYDDVLYTLNMKSRNRSKIAEYRRKQAECNQLRNQLLIPVTLPDKIREDKTLKTLKSKTINILSQRKESEPTSQTLLIEHFVWLWNKQYGQEYSYPEPQKQDYIQIANLLKQYKFTQIYNLIKMYIYTKNEYLNKTSKTIQLFIKSISTIIKDHAGTSF
jgi:hypothetical protein